MKFLNNRAVYDICIPNEEVRQIYEGIVDEWFQEQVQAIDMSCFYSKVLNGDTESFEKQVSLLLANSISFHNYNEQFYHGFITGLFQQLNGYQIKSNRISGDGVFDLAIIPETSKSKPAVIMEFKVVNKKDFMYTEDRCIEALNQIEDKEYFNELKSWGYNNIVKYGIAFIGRACRIMVER